MKSIIFLCLDLMIKYASKTMHVMDWLLVIRINHKKTVILIATQKRFFVKQSVFSLIRAAFFLSSIFLLIFSLVRAAFVSNFWL